MSTIEVRDIVHLGGDKYAINTNGQDGKPDGSYDMVVIGRPGPDGTILLDLPNNGAGTDMIVNPIYVGSSDPESSASSSAASSASSSASSASASRSSSSSGSFKITSRKIKAAAIVAAGFILFAIITYGIEAFKFYF